jgi:hypothetical protein
MYCKHCGDKLENDSKYCGKCGASISESVVKESPKLKGNKELQRGEKFKAGVIAWVGAGVAWGVLDGLGLATSDSVIAELITICIVVFVAMKIYRYYVHKWTAELNISQ